LPSRSIRRKRKRCGPGHYRRGAQKRASAIEFNASGGSCRSNCRGKRKRLPVSRRIRVRGNADRSVVGTQIHGWPARGRVRDQINLTAAIEISGEYVYLIPFQYGASGNVKEASKIVRYDTTKNFQSASSYEFFDLSTLPVAAAIKAQLGGFTGGVVVGQSLVLVPWGSRGNQQTNHVAVIYDTTRALNDPTAWQYMDLHAINAEAGGYQFGWVDKNGFMSFVPAHNYNMESPSVPPFITWNTTLPFTQVTSWETHPNTTGAWSTGVAYDPGTNTAWFAPYGSPSGNYVPLITQLQEK
jgi:hypothetical protein